MPNFSVVLGIGNMIIFKNDLAQKWKQLSQIIAIFFESNLCTLVIEGSKLLEIDKNSINLV